MIHDDEVFFSLIFYAGCNLAQVV